MAVLTAGNRWLRWTIFCALGSIALSGCGGSNRIPVAGTVTLDGKPLDGAIITLAPDPAKGNTAQISCSSPVKEGRYELHTTGTTRADSGSGVPPGWYKVTVRPDPKTTLLQPQAPVEKTRATKKRVRILAAQEERSRMAPPPANPIPAQYLSADKTPLEVEVKGNPESGAYDFSLKSR